MQTRPIDIVTKVNALLQAVRAATIAVVALACGLLCAQPINAQTIDHSGGFANHSDLTENMSISFPVYTFSTLGRLTNGTGQRGSLWSNNQVDITSFTTTFTFDINDARAFADGDGFMFVIQNDPRGTAATGPGGGGLGYGHDSPGPIDPDAIVKSVGVKFDTFMGNDCEVSNNATGLFTDGRSPTCPEPGSDDVQVDLNGTPINLHGRQPLKATLTYDGTTLTEVITNLVTMLTFTQTYTVNIPVDHVMGNMAYVGFTSATGGAAEVNDIESWTWQSPSP